MVAPASKAARVESTCSLMVIGTAGLCSLRGTEPVIATVMMHGVVIFTATARTGPSCPAPCPWGTASAVLQIQEVVVEVDFRQAQLRFAIISWGSNVRLLLIEDRHAALALAAELGSFRTGLRDVQP